MIMRETPVSSCEKNFLLEVTRLALFKLKVKTMLISLSRHYGRVADWMAEDGWTQETCQSALVQIGGLVRCCFISKKILASLIIIK